MVVVMVVVMVMVVVDFAYRIGSYLRFSSYCVDLIVVGCAWSVYVKSVSERYSFEATNVEVSKNGI